MTRKHFVYFSSSSLRCKMKFVTITALFLLITLSDALQNYMGTELQKCINCICHARSGCYSRFNCARYSVSFDYWKTANSPVLDIDDDPDNIASYQKCMKNENCILATMAQYVEAIGHLDCNCDGKFDCKDRAAIHLFGSQCRNPKFDNVFSRRFNTCAGQVGVQAMLAQEGRDGCDAPEVDAV